MSKILNFKIGDDLLKKIILAGKCMDLTDSFYESIRIYGFNIETAENAETALSKIVQSRCDFLVIDLMLHGVIGVIKSAKQTWQNIKIIVYSKFDDINVDELAFRIGADYCIVQPFSAGDLLRAMTEAVEWTF